MSRKIPVGSIKGRKIDFDLEEDTKSYDSKYTIRMYKKHTSTTFADAMSIVKKYPNSSDENFLFVYFNEANDDMKNLLMLAKAWKVFKFYINDKEIPKEEIDIISNTLFCEHKEYCEGICYNDVRFLYKGDRYWFSQYDIISELTDTSELNRWDAENHLGNKPWSEKKEMKTQIKYTINKDKLFEILDDLYTLTKQNCEVYNIDKVYEEIQKIEKEIKIPLYQSYSTIHQSSLEDKREFIDDYSDDTINTEKGNIILLSDEQIKALAKEISKEMEKVLVKLMKDKK